MHFKISHIMKIGQEITPAGDVIEQYQGDVAFSDAMRNFLTFGSLITRISTGRCEAFAIEDGRDLIKDAMDLMNFEVHDELSAYQAANLPSQLEIALNQAIIKSVKKITQKA